MTTIQWNIPEEQRANDRFLLFAFFGTVRLYKSGEICYTKSKLLVGRIRLAVGRLSYS